MGRKKMIMTPISEPKERMFLKRRAGLLKKAAEMSVLCKLRLFLIFEDLNEGLIAFSSPNCDLPDLTKLSKSEKSIVIYTEKDYPEFLLEKKKKKKQQIDSESEINMEFDLNSKDFTKKNELNNLQYLPENKSISKKIKLDSKTKSYKNKNESTIDESNKYSSKGSILVQTQSSQFQTPSNVLNYHQFESNKIPSEMYINTLNQFQDYQNCKVLPPEICLNIEKQNKSQYNLPNNENNANTKHKNNKCYNEKFSNEPNYPQNYQKQNYQVNYSPEQDECSNYINFNEISANKNMNISFAHIMENNTHPYPIPRTKYIKKKSIHPHNLKNKFNELIFPKNNCSCTNHHNPSSDNNLNEQHMNLNLKNFDYNNLINNYNDNNQKKKIYLERFNENRHQRVIENQLKEYPGNNQYTYENSHLSNQDFRDNTNLSKINFYGSCNETEKRIGNFNNQIKDKNQNSIVSSSLINNNQEYNFGFNPNLRFDNKIDEIDFYDDYESISDKDSQ